MSNKESRNRKHVMLKVYDVLDSEEMFELNKDIMSLTKSSARISLTVGTDTIAMYVYCRTNTSKVFKKCVNLEFKEF